MCRVVADTGAIFLHVIIPDSVKRAIPNLVVGSQLSIFEPWEMLFVKSAGRSVLLASERCQVVEVLDLAKVSLTQVDSLLLSDAVGSLPADLSAGLQANAANIQGLCSAKTVARAICSLPLAAMTLSDSPLLQQESYTMIKDLDAWMSEVNLRAGVLRAFPRAALVHEVTSSKKAGYARLPSPCQAESANTL